MSADSGYPLALDLYHSLFEWHVKLSVKVELAPQWLQRSDEKDRLPKFIRADTFSFVF